jgi:hypothetical protein
VSWGDGSKTTSGTMAAPGTLPAVHTYRQTGVFQVRVTLTDKDGGIGTGEYAVTVTKKAGR